MAKNSIIEKTGDGTTTQWSVNFTGGYTDEAHVTARVNNEIDGAGNAVYRDITFISAGIISVGGDPAGVGEPVVFQRITPISVPVNDFSAGAGFSAAAVDASFEQCLFGIQEAQDQLEGTKDLEAAVVLAEAAADNAVAAAPVAVAAAIAAEASAVEAADAAAAHTPYSNRADAVAAMVPDDIDAIRVVTPNDRVLHYAETVVTDRRVALISNGGTRYWAPADHFVSPQHYAENTDPGVTDMIAALEAMLYGVAHSPLVGVAYPDYVSLYYGAKSAAPTVVSLLGERVGISRPLVAGALDTDHDETFDVGSGALYGVKLTMGRLVALDSFDASPLATHTHPTEGLVTTIPGYALILGTYEITDKKATQENVFYVDGFIIDETFEIDCAFKCGGVYLTNTNRTSINAAHIFNMGVGTAGIRTGISDAQPTPNHLGYFNPLSGAPFATNGSQVKNPELRINRVSVSGRNRQGGVSFPDSNTSMTMDTHGIMIFTADFHLNAPIITATTSSIVFDLFSNGQFHNAHPWSNSIVYGPNCNNMITSGGYWDYTDIVLYSFRHLFVNCSWGAGSANMRLVAITADEDADGLVLAGCRFYNSSTLVHATEASGSWVGGSARKYMLSAIYSELDDVPLLQAGDTFRVGSDGAVTVSLNGNPSAYMAGAADGSFLIVPYNGAGASDLNSQLRFDVNEGNWRIGRSAAGSNGKGIILRDDNGVEYLLHASTSGTAVLTAL